MRTVYKYVISKDSIEGSIWIPGGFKILHFDIQYYEPTLWVEVDPEEPEVLFNYAIFGTGWKIDSNYSYIGTCQDHPFVWHLYERN